MPCVGVASHDEYAPCGGVAREGDFQITPLERPSQAGTKGKQMDINRWLACLLRASGATTANGRAPRGNLARRLRAKGGEASTP